MQPGIWVSQPLPPLDEVARPAFAVPQHAVDCHMHVFGAAARYPASPDARYTLPEGTVSQYAALAAALGLERAVLVQPSYYGTDNRCLLDAMMAFAKPCRGVVFLSEQVSQPELDNLTAHGVCGLRLDFFKAPQETPRLLREAEAIARRQGWHIELYAPGKIVVALEKELAALTVHVSINHLGYLKPGDGDDAFDRLLALAALPHVWVKLTAPYRVDADTARTDAMARRLIAAAPTRLVWGSDWPHVMVPMPDTGALLNRLAVWCPDAAARQAILVRNPERLYGFEAAP